MKKEYPLNKYRFYSYVKNSVNHIAAVSTYAGKWVRGVAICSADDEYDVEKGKALAAARCALKVAEKRHQRATHKLKEAAKEQEKANKFYTLMASYYNDSIDEMTNAQMVIDDLMTQM